MKEKEKSLDVPISAMIDVVFLLLVFFIVTAKTPVDEASVSVNLPGKGPDEESKKEQIIAKVYEDKYVINGRAYKLNEVEAYFSAVAADLQDVTVEIKVSVDARHQDVVLLLDKLKKVNLKKFNLHTLK